VARWPGGQVARWPGGQVVRWPGGQVAWPGGTTGHLLLQGPRLLLRPGGGAGARGAPQPVAVGPRRAVASSLPSCPSAGSRTRRRWCAGSRAGASHTGSRSSGPVCPVGLRVCLSPRTLHYHRREAACGSDGVSSWLLGQVPPSPQPPRQGARAGDVVAAVLPNCPEYPILFSGVAGAGLGLTPINPSFTAGEIHQQVAPAVSTDRQVAAAGSRWVVTTEEGRHRLAPGLGAGGLAFVTVEGESAPGLASLLSHRGPLPAPPRPEAIAQVPPPQAAPALPSCPTAPVPLGSPRG
jgi:hypothetical protein